MSIASGYKKFKKYILTSSGFQLVSHWTKANTLEFDDGKTAQDKLGAIDGISSSRESNSDKIAASTALVSELNSDLNVRYNPNNDMLQVKFNGNWINAQNSWIQSKQVWIAGVTRGFTSKILEVYGSASHNISYNTDYMQLAISRQRYTWITVRLQCVDIVDLTNISTINMLYDYSGDGITKLTIGVAPVADPSTYEASNVVTRAATGDVIKGSITLDVANVKGAQYVFIEAFTPNAGEQNNNTLWAYLRIRAITALI